MCRPSALHILADENREGRRPIRIGIVLHGVDKHFVHHSIGLEALYSLAKVLKNLMVMVLLIDDVAGPLGC